MFQIFFLKPTVEELEKENQNLKDLLKLHEIMDGKDPNDDFGDSIEASLEKIDFEKARMIKELIDYKSISDTSTQCHLSFVQDINSLKNSPKLICSSILSNSNNSTISINCDLNCRASLPSSSQVDSLDELFEPVCKSHI